MGLLNPFLYQNADAFTDVTKGSNKVGRGGQALPYGYNCSAGWDPATGLGTPKFDKLLAAAMGGGPGPSPGPSPAVCKATEFCCPDAKKCLTPTHTSCAADGDAACASGDVCCPLTKICVTPGADCVSPCQGSFCCPDAKACLTPVHPGKFCGALHKCKSDEVCCPLIKECVKAGATCTPP